MMKSKEAGFAGLFAFARSTKPFPYVKKIILLLVAFAFAICASSAIAANDVPPLTVVVVIDQLPMSYLDRFGDLFGEGGFKRLEREGLLYTQCRYSHAIIETMPGHTTLATGTNAHDHGIVGNAWYRADGTEQYSAACDSVFLVGDSGVTTEKASCPQNIRVDGLSDFWATQFGDAAKVWSLSMKDRAAIAMGGKKPDGALWFSRKLGKFVSSSYYFDELPQWCRDANSTLTLYMDSTWTRVAKDSAYFRCDTDNAWYEDGHNAGLPNTLPKSMGDGTRDGYFRALQASPFGDMILLMMTGECLASESLGQDDVPDLLWVSFSSNDVCGHLFGPLSQEVLDMTVRTDSMLEKFLNAPAQPLALRLHRAAVHLDQRLHQREADAEAVARALERAVDLREHVEEPRQASRGAMPMPLSRTRMTASAPPAHGQLDVAAVVGELGGVVQQVAEHLGQPRRIGVEHAPGSAAASPSARGVAARSQRRGGLDRLVARRRQVDRLPAQLDLAPRDARMSSRSSTRRTSCPTCRSIISQAARHGFAIAARRALQDLAAAFVIGASGIAQLVRQHRQELVLAAVGLGEVRGQPLAIGLGPLAVGDVDSGRGQEQRRGRPRP